MLFVSEREEDFWCSDAKTHTLVSTRTSSLPGVWAETWTVLMEGHFGVHQPQLEGNMTKLWLIHSEQQSSRLEIDSSDLRHKEQECFQHL